MRSARVFSRKGTAGAPGGTAPAGSARGCSSRVRSGSRVHARAEHATSAMKAMNAMEAGECMWMVSTFANGPRERRHAACRAKSGRYAALLAFPGTIRTLHRHWPLGVCLTFAVVSCARRAPGPEECHALAIQWASRESAALSYRPGDGELESVESQILERTTECLTTPYDRELVGCVGSGASPRRCLRAFETRRKGGRPAP